MTPRNPAFDVNSWKVILATMAIFGAGVVTGGLLVTHSKAARPGRFLRPAQPARVFSASSPSASRFEFLRRVQRELDLTPEQRDRVDAILKESQERTKRLMEPVVPKLREEVQRARTGFRELLTPGQRERFDLLIKQQRPQHEQHRSPAPASTETVTNR